MRRAGRAGCSLCPSAGPAGGRAPWPRGACRLSVEVAELRWLWLLPSQPAGPVPRALPGPAVHLVPAFAFETLTPRKQRGRSGRAVRALSARQGPVEWGCARGGLWDPGSRAGGRTRSAVAITAPRKSALGAAPTGSHPQGAEPEGGEPELPRLGRGEAGLGSRVVLPGLGRGLRWQVAPWPRAGICGGKSRP